MANATSTTIEKPEWIDARRAKNLFGICKSALYVLKDEGKVKTSSLKKRGNSRGKRLFSYDDIKAHIEAHQEQPKLEAAAGVRGDA